MSQLTPIQQKLVDGMIAEFKRMNPKPTDPSKKRFTIASIDDCKREEERFIESVKRHNLTMIKVFDKQFKDELKAFTKEFGKVFDTQLGYVSPYAQNKVQHGYDEFIQENKLRTVQGAEYYEFYLFIVSKIKEYRGDNNYCNSRAYRQIYVDFKRERVNLILESGKEVYAYKIIGLNFCDYSYSNRDKHGHNRATLDEFIQTSQSTQRAFVEMTT